MNHQQPQEQQTMSVFRFLVRPSVRQLFCFEFMVFLLESLFPRKLIEQIDVDEREKMNRINTSAAPTITLSRFGRLLFKHNPMTNSPLACKAINKQNRSRVVHMRAATLPRNNKKFIKTHNCCGEIERNVRLANTLNGAV